MIRLAVLAASLGAAGAGLRAAEPAPSKEYQIKAVFLYNFTQFVQWPATAFRDGDAPFVITVFGQNPFGDALENAVRGERIGDRPIVVQHVTRLQDLTTCHVLFVSASERANAEKIVALKKGQPVLVVGDMPGFLQRGATINFFLEGAKIRFEIDPVAAQQTGLKFGSQLLQLARIAASSGGRGPN